MHFLLVNGRWPVQYCSYVDLMVFTSCYNQLTSMYMVTKTKQDTQMFFLSESSLDAFLVVSVQNQPISQSGFFPSVSGGGGFEA